MKIQIRNTMNVKLVETRMHTCGTQQCCQRKFKSTFENWNTNNIQMSNTNDIQMRDTNNIQMRNTNEI